MNPVWASGEREKINHEMLNEGEGCIKKKGGGVLQVDLLSQMVTGTYSPANPVSSFVYYDVVPLS